MLQRVIMKPIFILGPTGSGKTALALALAERLGAAEIVSADAYQVYRGMEILTAAPSTEELARVPHHLISCLDPSEPNDAATHARRAQRCLEEIAARGKRAIVTGGSGLYVRFISHGISPAPPSDPALRAELSELPLEELVRRLRELDPEGAALTPLENPRYVCRNLEIVILGGKPLSFWRQNWVDAQPAGPGFCVQRETAELDARLARRARGMLDAGALKELRALGDLRRLSQTAQKTLGLSELAAFLAAREPELRARLEPCLPADASREFRDEEELASALALTTRRYAKRQRTWLRRETWLHPLPLDEQSDMAAVADRLPAMVEPELA